MATIQELVSAAKGGSDKARRIAWARIVDAREMLYEPKYATFRRIAGKDTLRTLKSTIEWASEELRRAGL
jgi:hypothetical protein